MQAVTSDQCKRLGLYVATDMQLNIMRIPSLVAEPRDLDGFERLVN